eukprot:5005063-Pyramimonas_sp.AAC.1
MGRRVETAGGPGEDREPVAKVLVVFAARSQVDHGARAQLSNDEVELQWLLTQRKGLLNAAGPEGAELSNIIRELVREVRRSRATLRMQAVLAGFK